MRLKTVCVFGAVLFTVGCAAAPASTGGGSSAAPATSVSVSPTSSAAATKAGPLGTIELEAGQTDQQLAADFTKALEVWNNAGVETIVAYQSGKTGMSAEEAAAEVALANQSKFVQPLFGDAASSPNIADLISDMTKANENTLKYAILTDPTASLANEENYRRNREMTSVDSRPSSGSERTLVIGMRTSSNYKKTSFRDKQTDADDVSNLVYTVTFKAAGPREVITKLSRASK